MNNSYTFHFNNICNYQVTDSAIKRKRYTPPNINQRTVRQFLNIQEQLGFHAAWFITFHYFHPSELMYSIKERNTDFDKGVIERVGYKTNNGSSIWTTSGDRRIINMRNDPDQVSNDCNHFINIILNELFNIKRPRNYRGELPPILSFIERGYEQYHSHLVIPACSPKHNDQTKLYYLLNNKVRKKMKSLSKWKTIDVRPVHHSRGLYSYLNKQTNAGFTSLDPMSSLLIHPTTKRVTRATSYHYQSQI